MSKVAFGPRSPRPYSAGIVAGPFVFVSGQVGVDRETGRVVGASAREQTVVALDNLAAILAEQGLTLADVVKTTVFLTDMAAFEEMNAVYRERFPEPFPTRSTVGVASLARPELNVEIEAIALAR